MAYLALSGFELTVLRSSDFSISYWSDIGRRRMASNRVDTAGSESTPKYKGFPTPVPTNSWAGARWHRTVLNRITRFRDAFQQLTDKRGRSGMRYGGADGIRTLPYEPVRRTFNLSHNQPSTNTTTYEKWDKRSWINRLKRSSVTKEHGPWMKGSGPASNLP